MENLVKLTKKDFESGQEVRWCPGCGDYSILATLQRTLPALGIPKEKHVFVSGIGCASRFPYYMNTYGFHTIHGRAPTIASGLKVANPDLNVWVISGDGDALSIGGNHLIHLLRRNVNLNFLLFNNRIYGLTKGQYSPTSEAGKLTKSTPYGSLEAPINPLALALSAGATFVARSLDVDAAGLSAILEQAVKHNGTSFVEIYQNCNVFNDGAYDLYSDRATRSERTVSINNGEFLMFGKDSEKAINLDGLSPVIVESSAANLKYDASSKALAQLIASLDPENFPVPLGVLYQEDRPAYDQLIWEQAKHLGQKNDGDLDSLLFGDDSWEVG